MDLAESHSKADDLAGADVAFRDAYRRMESLGFGETETAGTLLNNWALVASSRGHPLEAERLFRRAVDISRSDGGEANVSPFLLTNLARSLEILDRLEEAEGYASRAESEARRTENRVALDLAIAAHAQIEVRRGELDAADRHVAELGAHWSDAFPPGHYLFGILASLRGLLAEARGDLATARAEQDRAIAILDATPQRVGALPMILLRRSALALRQADPERAAADAKLAIELKTQMDGAASPAQRVGVAHLLLGRALTAQGKSGDARTEFVAALAHLEPTVGADHPDTRAARELAATTGAAKAPPL
jgi:tetratricopeptide (TPR) repeat protein